MIDYRFILLLVFSAMLIFSSLYNRKDGINEGMKYISGFGFFFIGLDMLVGNSIADTSVFLNLTTSILFWGIGIIVLLKTSLNQIESEG